VSKLLNLTILITLNFLSGMVFACETDFLKEYDKGKQATLNNMGWYFSNLGACQDEFYQYCKELDSNKAVLKPVVALFGEAYGVRAAEILQQTSRLTVVLNDLDERHFAKIQKWSKDNNCVDRLKLAPCSFFDTHKRQCVQNFFNGSPINFHAILVANVFHLLHPAEVMKGLRYIADHLVDGGEAFIVNWRQIDKSILFDSLEPSIAQQLLQRSQSPHHPQDIKDNSNLNDKVFLGYCDTFLEWLLYKYNRRHKVLFPGYRSPTALYPSYKTLNYPLLKEDATRVPFLSSTPEEMKRWSQPVGLTCKEIKYINPSDPISSSNFFFGEETNKHYFLRLKKELPPNEAKYKSFLKQAQTIDQRLQQLHAGKFFEIMTDPHHFAITDAQTQERFYVRKPYTDDKKEKEYLTDRVFTHLDTYAAVELGRLYKKEFELADPNAMIESWDNLDHKEDQKFKMAEAFEYAKALFLYAADMDEIEAQDDLDELMDLK
jgi:hypothetical protein